MAIEILPMGLNGTVHVPPSKSISHRAIIAGALSQGKSIITNVVLSEDIKATINALISLGAHIEMRKDEGDRHQIIIHGKGSLEPVETTIDCIESGSTLRFLIPIAALSGGRVTFQGRGKLIERPLDVYYEIFNNQGIQYRSNDGKLPLTIWGKLKPDKFYIRGDISSQFITGLLFALPLLDEDSEIIMETPLESKGYVDLTIDVLKSFGVHVKNSNYDSFYIKGNQKYIPAIFNVEGDFSQAAFWLAGGVLSGSVACKGLNMKSLQGDKEILKIIQAMGGRLEIEDDMITAYKSNLKAIDIDASQIPDLVPIIAVMAALSEGRAAIKNAGRLRIKESDRLKAIARELNKIGGKVTELDDGLIIEGVESFTGGAVDCWNDHRIAMALAIAAARCQKPLVIMGEEAVKKSYTSFWDDYKQLVRHRGRFSVSQQTKMRQEEPSPMSQLGGEINERNMGK